MAVFDISTTTIPADVINQAKMRWEEGQVPRRARREARRKLPLIRLWDGDWNYVGTVNDAIEASFQWRMNDTGSGHIELPVDSYLAKWAMNFKGRATKNVHATMDKDGARWGGTLESANIVKSSDGKRFISLNFLHEYEEMKHIYVWPNPYLPAIVQFPRLFILVGPTAWVLKTALFVNVHRLAGNAYAVPDDPFDLGSWLNFVRPDQWPLQVAPSKAVLGDSTPWTVISSRMKNWHELAAPKLADAQLMVTTRRWLTGDDPPWEGADLKHGALVVDIVDKSGYWSTRGTATHGDIWKGLVRTVQEVINDFDTQETVINTPVDPPEYKWHNFLSTEPDAPYVTYRDGSIAGVEASEFKWQPATAVQVVTGGSSMQGVNEAISTGIQLVGNMFGGLFGAGAIIDTFLQPIYADTIMAWQSIKSSNRARELGWSHYYEHFAEGADKAYTISSILALRQGFWETREKTSHRVTLQDGAPWFIGESGKGHFFLGDRIGATITGLPDGQMVVEQVTELTYSLSRSSRGWTAVCGDRQAQQSPLETVMGRVRSALGAVHDLGVLK